MKKWKAIFSNGDRKWKWEFKAPDEYHAELWARSSNLAKSLRHDYHAVFGRVLEVKDDESEDEQTAEEGNK